MHQRIAVWIGRARTVEGHLSAHVVWRYHLNCGGAGVGNRRSVGCPKDGAGVVTVGNRARADNPCLIVDGSSGRKVAAERAQVNHLAVLPEKRVKAMEGGSRRVTNNLTSLVDVIGNTKVVPAEGPQISHLSVLPKKRSSEAERRVTPPYYLPQPIKCLCFGASATQSSDVSHPICPKESMPRIGRNIRRTVAYHSPRVVDGHTIAEVTVPSWSAQIGHLAIFPDKRVTHAR